MEWCVPPALVHVHVTVPPTATVSTAGLADALCPLLKKMLPTATAAVSGAVLPPVPPLVPPPVLPPVFPPVLPLGAPPTYPPPVDGPEDGLVGEYPEQPASTARVIAVKRRVN